jgi:hypothetical protein
LINYNAEIDYEAMNITVHIPPNVYNRITEQEYKKQLIIIYSWTFLNINDKLKDLFIPETKKTKKKKKKSRVNPFRDIFQV